MGRYQMNRETVFANLRDIFLDVLDLDAVALSDATTADDIDEWDSLSHIRLVVTVERHFKVKFSNAEIEGFTRVGDLVDGILRKLV